VIVDIIGLNILDELEGWPSGLRREFRPEIDSGLSRVYPGTKTMKFHYIYLLLLKDSDIYTGFTSDLKRRLKQHESGGVISTKHKRPVKLVHYEAYLEKEDAKRRERFLKSSDGKKLLKQQLSVLLQKYR